MLENQLPTPPLDAVMPPANGAIAVICFALLGLFILWAAREARRTRSPLPLLIVVAGACASLIEPILDHVGAIWYPQYGAVPVLRAFNVSLPVWAIAAYGLYVGALSTVLYKKLTAGITVQQLWFACFLIWTFNFCLETPGLNLGIYSYYGAQPFTILGFPLWWAATNVTIPVLVAGVLVSYKDAFVGARMLLIVPIVPMLAAAGEAASGWPMWLAMNSGAGTGAKTIAGFLTMSFSLLIVYLFSLKFCKPSFQPSGATL